MKTRSILTLALICWVTLPSIPIRAGPPRVLAKEFVEKMTEKFGREIAAEGTETVAKRLAQLGEHCGANAVRVFEHTGPAGLRALEAAGPDAARLAPLLAESGKEAAWLVAHPERTALVLRHGEVAAKALIRHRQVREGFVREWGGAGAHALIQLNRQNGRRLAMLLEAGQPLAKPEAKKLLGVIADHGNPALDFVWRNKGALTVTAALVAFVNDPKPFLAGGRDLAQGLGHTAVQHVAKAACEASREINWTLVVSVVAGIASVWFCLRYARKRQAVQESKQSTSP